MHTFMIVFWIVFVLFYLFAFAFAGYKFYRGYQQATGTTLERLHATFTASATLVWGYAQIIGSYVIDNIQRIADAFNAPEVSGFIMTKVDPGWFATFLFFGGFVTMVARLRNLFKDE